jgi:imidazolonepropionase-like amidohydrolase
MAVATFRALAACALLFLSSCATAPPLDADLYYNFTLLDPATARHTDNAYLLVAEGRIVRVGAGDPPSVDPSRTHDMQGAYALPGLIDTHAHVTLGRVVVRMENDAPVLVATSEDDITTHNARMLVAHGVTTIRNPAGDSAANARYAANIRTGEWFGPTALSAGTLLDTTRFDGLSVVVTDAVSIEREVAAQAAAGMDYVKLYHGLNEAQLAVGIEAAHRHGLRAITHTGAVTWTRAAELGVDAIVHAMPISADALPPDRRDGYQDAHITGAHAFYTWWERADLDGPEMREMIAALAEHNVTVDLTLVTFMKAFWGDDDAVRTTGAEFAHPLVRENWRVFRFDMGWAPENYARARAVWPKIQRFTRMLHEAGVPLTMGTDLAKPFMSPGYDLHTEMQLHPDADIPAWAVLRMATSDAAETLGLEDSVGRIARGYEADIVFTRTDPSQDVGNIRSVRSVLLNGRAFEAHELRASSP